MTSSITTSKTTPTGAQQPAATPAGGPLPDLNVRIIGVGVIDPSTGDFVANVPATQGLIAAVEFDIANKGSATARGWSFSAHLPTMTDGAYSSPVQAPLAPGAHIVNTLRFSQLQAGGGTFTVSVNPAGTVQESNTSNNSASAEVSGY
jgi:hypothetical protein